MDEPLTTVRWKVGPEAYPSRGFYLETEDGRDLGLRAFDQIVAQHVCDVHNGSLPLSTSVLTLDMFL